MSIPAFLEYLSLEKKCSPHTLKAYQANLEAFELFITEQGSLETIDEVSYGEIRAWIVSLIQSGNTPRTVNRKLSALRSYYKFLLRIGSIPVSPLKEHKALKTDTKVALPFSQEEIQRLLAADFFPEEYTGVLQRTVIQLLYYTGIRRSELIELKVQDVDLSEGLMKVLGKRNKERLLPLLPEIKTQLSQLLEQQKQYQISRESEHFFVNSRGKKLSEAFVYETVKKYFSEVTTKIKKSPHVLRHSFASHLLDQGAGINAIKELLGHSSVAATQHYTHSSMSTIKSVYKKAHPRERK